MKRAVLALALLALTLAALSGGTFANFTQTSSNSASTSTATSFLPVNQSAPSITGTVGLNNVITLASGSWDYTHATGQTLDTSGEQAIAQVEQWQYCLLGTCHDITGQTGGTLTLTGTIVTLIGGSLVGVTIRVSETASNASGTAAAVLSNTVS